MSSSSQGPGWWQASDGQWYPPQAKPGAFLPIKTKRPVYKRWYFWVLVEQQTLTFAAISGSGTCVCSHKRLAGVLGSPELGGTRG